MLFYLIGILLASILLYIFNKLQNDKLRHFPGPSSLRSLPLLGHGYLLGKNPISSLFELRKSYGTVFRLDIGDLPTLWLCDFESITKTNKSDAFIDRPYSSIPAFSNIRPRDSRGNIVGPGTSNGKVWAEQRKFAITHLSDLGMGSVETMENIIVQEAEYLCNRIGNFNGKSFQCHGFFLVTINNVIWRIATGKRTNQDDPKLLDLTQRVSIYFKTLAPGSLLNNLQLYSPTISRLSSMLGISNPVDIVSRFNEMLEELAVKGQSECEGESDFIKRCWDEVGKNTNNPNSSFYGSDGILQVIGQLTDLFVAGTDTVSTFLEWALLYMASYPDIQEKAHHQIKECVGTSGSISLNDSFRLPYVQAVVEEIFRHSPETGLSVPRFTSYDYTLDGKTVPKGTQVFSFVAAVHMDDKHFSEPLVFNPERFLDESGEVFVKSEHLLAFGSGRRKCLGERLARSESFLFFSHLIQNFKFSKVDESQVLDFNPLSGLIFYPKPYQLLVTKRS